MHEDFMVGCFRKICEMVRLTQVPEDTHWTNVESNFNKTVGLIAIRLHLRCILIRCNRTPLRPSIENHRGYKDYIVDSLEIKGKLNDGGYTLS